MSEQLIHPDQVMTTLTPVDSGDQPDLDEDFNDRLLPDDPELTATAALIADLRHEIAMLRAERIKPVVPQYEVEVLQLVSQSNLQAHLNDGWAILHIQFVDDSLNVVFMRELRAAPLAGDRVTARQMVQPVPGTHVAFQPPSSLHAALNRPLTRALREKGLGAVIEQQNADILTAGQNAFEASLAANPPSVPTLTPGEKHP